MRILIVHPGPEFSVADVFNGWKTALEDLGNQVAVYNTNDRLAFYSGGLFPDYTKPVTKSGRHRLRKLESEEAMRLGMQGLSHDLYTFWPQVVIFVSGFYLQSQVLQVIRGRGHKLVLIHTESPYQDDEQLLRAQYADVNLVNDPANLQEYKDLVPASYYIPHAYNPVVHHPPYLGADKVADFAFVGTMFRSRQAFFEAMHAAGGFEGLRVALGGSGWDAKYLDDSPLLEFLGHPREECVENKETSRIYREARAGINFYRREGEGEHVGQGWAMGPREVEMAACGLPFVRDPRGESDEIFPFLPKFSSPEEAAHQLKWLLSDEQRRADLAVKARAAVEDRTFVNNAKFLLMELGKKGVR